jgi:hypothetical protein
MQKTDINKTDRRFQRLRSVINMQDIELIYVNGDNYFKVDTLSRFTPEGEYPRSKKIEVTIISKLPAASTI